MGNRVDFKQAKRVPIGSVLRLYRIEARRQGDYLLAPCPLPTHSSKEKNSFKVNVRENWWTCFSGSCRAKLGKSGGDSVDFVKWMDGTDDKAAAQKLTELFCLGEKHIAQPTTMVEPFAENRNKLLTFQLQANPEHPLIQSHGISVETAREFGVGYYRSKQGTASMDDRIIFPLLENGVGLVGYLGRATLEGQEPRWKFGAKQKSFLFGLERCDPSKPLILTESCWAALYYFERGHQCASMMGSALTEAQEQRLVPFDTIILAMDADEKGKAAGEEIRRRLRKNHKVIVARLKQG